VFLREALHGELLNISHQLLRIIFLMTKNRKSPIIQIKTQLNHTKRTIFEMERKLQ
jgi:hypothetical protein